jgi:hypothetical protein
LPCGSTTAFFGVIMILAFNVSRQISKLHQCRQMSGKTIGRFARDALLDNATV